MLEFVCPLSQTNYKTNQTVPPCVANVPSVALHGLPLCAIAGKTHGALIPTNAVQGVVDDKDKQVQVSRLFPKPGTNQGIEIKK